MRRNALILSLAFIVAAAGFTSYKLLSFRHHETPGGGLVNSSLSGSYAIAVPPDGDVLDGGLIIRSVSPRPLTLVGISLLDRMDAAPVNLVQARVLLLDSGTAEAVGIRQGLPSATIGAGEQRSLLGTVLTGNSPHEYEILLGIHASGLGPWRATAVRVTYRDGGSTRSQTFSHDLTICEPSQAQCSPVGRYTVDAA